MNAKEWTASLNVTLNTILRSNTVVGNVDSQIQKVNFFISNIDSVWIFFSFYFRAFRTLQNKNQFLNKNFLRCGICFKERINSRMH